MKTRREFLHTALSSFGIASLGIASLSALAMGKNVDKAFAQEIASEHESKTIVKQTVIAMGTFVSFTTSLVSNTHAKEVFAKAIQEIARLEKIFSRHDTNSALSHLNKEGKLEYAPQELLYVLDKSLEIARNTNEIYNPAVKPLLDVYEAQQNIEKSVQAISADQIKEAQELIQLSQIQIKDNDILFKKKNMSITLDSLAKGFIIDRASEILLKNGIENHIINAGGDIIAKGRKSPTEAWIIGIEDPRNPAKVLTSFALENAAVATSGAYQKFFDKDAQRHHIINPHTALSPKIFSISCKAENAMLADAYSTVNSLSSTSSYKKFLI